jgi:hypothetical protein
MKTNELDEKVKTAQENLKALLDSIAPYLPPVANRPQVKRSDWSIEAQREIKISTSSSRRNLMASLS